MQAMVEKLTPERRRELTRTALIDAAADVFAKRGFHAASLEEMGQIETEMERGRERMREFEQELRPLGVLLKDYFSGLIDFPCWKEDREIYLCWKLGEPEVGHWHELEAGFAGRQCLRAHASRN